MTGRRKLWRRTACWICHKRKHCRSDRIISCYRIDHCGFSGIESGENVNEFTVLQLKLPFIFSIQTQGSQFAFFGTRSVNSPKRMFPWRLFKSQKSSWYVESKHNILISIAFVATERVKSHMSMNSHAYQFTSIFSKSILMGKVIFRLWQRPPLDFRQHLSENLTNPPDGPSERLTRLTCFFRFGHVTFTCRAFGHCRMSFSVDSKLQNCCPPPWDG